MCGIKDINDTNLHNEQLLSKETNLKAVRTCTYVSYAKFESIMFSVVNSMSGGIHMQEVVSFTVVNVYVTQCNERCLLFHSCSAFVSLLLHENCCFVLVVSSGIRLHVLSYTYVIKIDYRGTRSVDGLKRAIIYRPASTCSEKRKNATARATNKMNEKSCK